MTAPNPTAAEQAEVSRFGMFDLDILAEMEEHADDALPCWIADCDAEADAALVTRCCRRDRRNLCAEHVQLTRDRWLSEADTSKVSCTTCGHVFPAGTPFDAILEVVPL